SIGSTGHATPSTTSVSPAASRTATTGVPSGVSPVTCGVGTGLSAVGVAGEGLVGPAPADFPKPNPRRGADGPVPTAGVTVAGRRLSDLLTRTVACSAWWRGFTCR